MAQIRGTAGYNLNQNFGGVSSRNDRMDEPSALDTIRVYTDKIEEALDTLSEPVKPYVHPHDHSSSPHTPSARPHLGSSNSFHYSSGTQLVEKGTS